MPVDQKLSVALLGLLTIAGPGAGRAASAPYMPIYAFAGGTDGAGPGNLVAGRKGTFFGATTGGGINRDGTLFSVRRTLTGWKYAKEWDFNGADGKAPAAFVAHAGGILGITPDGGADYDPVHGKIGSGTIWGFAPGATPGAGSLTVIADFASTGLSNPVSLARASTGLLAGVAYGGGANGYGGIFVYDPRRGTLQDVYDFTRGVGTINTDHGQAAAGIAVSKAGVIYGAFPYDQTDFSSRTGTGSVFALAPPPAAGGGWSLTILCQFTTAAVSGSIPGDVTFSARNILVGTTQTGGADNLGTAFACGTSTPAPPVTLASFPGNPASGDYGDQPLPTRLVRGATPNTFYGTSQVVSGSQAGAVFRITLDNNKAPLGATLTPLFGFAPSGLNQPAGRLVYSRKYNELIGTAANGGPAGAGGIFIAAP